MSASSGNQYHIGQYVRGKGIYFGTAEIFLGKLFHQYADIDDVTVQNLMRTRDSKQALGSSEKGFLLNNFRNAVHALNNATLPDIERIKDRPADRPDISYEAELMRRLSSYRSGDLSGRFIPTLGILGDLHDFTRISGRYISCTESVSFKKISDEILAVNSTSIDLARAKSMHKSKEVANLRLVRVECV